MGDDMVKLTKGRLCQGLSNLNVYPHHLQAPAVCLALFIDFFFSRSGAGLGICLSNMLDAFGLGAILERAGA